jgi:hypothetical protein
VQWFLRFHRILLRFRNIAPVPNLVQLYNVTAFYSFEAIDRDNPLALVEGTTGLIIRLAQRSEMTGTLQTAGTALDRVAFASTYGVAGNKKTLLPGHGLAIYKHEASDISHFPQFDGMVHYIGSWRPHRSLLLHGHNSRSLPGVAGEVLSCSRTAPGWSFVEIIRHSFGFLFITTDPSTHIRPEPHQRAGMRIDFAW